MIFLNIISSIKAAIFYYTGYEKSVQVPRPLCDDLYDDFIFVDDEKNESVVCLNKDNMTKKSSIAITRIICGKMFEQSVVNFIREKYHEYEILTEKQIRKINTIITTIDVAVIGKREFIPIQIKYKKSADNGNYIKALFVDSKNLAAIIGKKCRNIVYISKTRQSSNVKYIESDNGVKFINIIAEDLDFKKNAAAVLTLEENLGKII